MTAPKRVLVTEDQALIALAIESELLDAGCEMIGPFRTCAEAEAWLRADTPDFAILDVELADGPCSEVALDLQARGVPFAVFSGSRKAEVAPVFLTAKWYAKPADLRELIAAEALGSTPVGAEPSSGSSPPTKTALRFQVFSDGPSGPTSAPTRSVADVDLYVAALRARSHVNIRVAREGDEPVPYDDWKLANEGPRPGKRGDST